eukprot:CAMPEP_0169118364 /NCGR_PEP_ID=MMETSP1015-20121227/30958_1 /TAXON_ID=342587 /ORGANISM="Karlodinium micrum, Strain CCMP2283" /LENGTH=97 /DNA_ID=CAMNT_0009181121 /DNA_START=70 /DNA_END=363 /DNA_ORIENTATION=-
MTFSFDRGERQALVEAGRFTISVALSKSIPEVAKAAAMAAAAAARPGGGCRTSSSACSFDVVNGISLCGSAFSLKRTGEFGTGEEVDSCEAVWLTAG